MYNDENVYYVSQTITTHTPPRKIVLLANFNTPTLQNGMAAAWWLFSFVATDRLLGVKDGEGELSPGVLSVDYKLRFRRKV